MAVRHFILATAGHVDHGKSALVKALTGTDPDRLPEEKARGITIDLGFAHFELPAPNINPAGDPNAPADTFQVGIVDVPGHEDFVKNMVAGVGAIDLALLVVAADDGWMPQSEEHLEILSYLGAQRAIIALTKIDLVPGREQAATAEGVREALRNSPFADAPLLHTSVVTGRGLEELKSTLAQVLANTPPSRHFAKPRLPVDRVFTLQGIGTVVTGTLIGGSLARGQAVVVQPAGIPTRIRTIQSYNREVETAAPGTRTALNVPDLGSRSKVHAPAAGNEVRRGDVVTIAELGHATQILDVVLQRSARQGRATPGRLLKDGALVRIHLGSTNYPARLLLHGKTQLLPGENALAQLRFDTPVFAFVGDRFIVRDWPEQATLAGGMILDSEGNPKSFHKPSQQKFLETRAQHPGDVATYAQSQIVRDRAVRRSGLLVQSRFSAEEITAALRQMVQQKQLVEAGEWLTDASWWTEARAKTAGLIRSHHQKHPEQLGLTITELRNLLPEEGEILEALLMELCRTDFVAAGGVIRARSHLPTLPAPLQAAGARIRAALAAKPLDPPSRKELAPDAASQQALRFLVQTGEAIDCGADVVLSSEAYGRAVAAIKKHILEHGPATVSALRQVLGSTRRVMVPLLEKLDRDGITLRQGDQRALRAPHAL